MFNSLYVDFNSYFASVEQAINPELRGKPIAVVPVESDTTVAIAASYEAKKFGVSTGTVIGEAKKMCPGLILVRAQHKAYVQYHHRLVDVVESVIHVKKVFSIDEMACELVGSMRTEKRSVEIAHAVKKAIAETVSPALTCSIGIAPNDYLAKTATDMQKPDGLVLITLDQLPHVLHSLELRDLCGIGKKMYERCWKNGIYTVEMLCDAPKHKLREIWGGVEGERLWQRLRGENVPLGETHKSTIGHSHVLAPALRDLKGASGVLHRLLQKAAVRLRSYGYLTSNLKIKVGYRDGMKWKCDLNITPTQDTMQLTAVLSAMLERLPTTSHVPIQVSVALNKLHPVGSVPEAMFENTGPGREKLNTGLDTLNSKYGKNTVYVGTAYNALRSAEMRIAFTHIPDEE